MAIIFKKLRYKNFLSTGNQFTEIDLIRNRTTLIVGENGSGKSTILDALTFGLFGKPYRPINIPQLVNSITKKNTIVEIEFSVGSIEYKIVRGLLPKIFEIYKNDELINKAANNKDYQATLETQILKVNFKSFCQVVVLGSATFKPFMQLIAYERREVIEDLLDLKIFTSMNSLLKNRIMMNGHRNNTAINSKKSIEDKIYIVKDHLTKLMNSTQEFINEKKERIEKCGTDIKDLLEKIKTKEEFQHNIQVMLSNNDSIRNKHKILNDLKYGIEFNRDNATKEINFYNKNNKCSTCLQDIHEDFKAKKLAENNEKLVALLNGLNKLEESLKSCEEILKDDEINRIVLSQTKVELAELKTKEKSLQSYKNELEREVRSVEVKNNQEDKDKLIALETELVVIEKEISDSNTEKELLSIASSLLKDSGIKAKIIKQYVPIINKLINKYLSALDFFVQFELNEEFKETIKSRYRDDFSYASFSEGEKSKINLAILFTWRAVSKLRNSMNTNLLIFDETLDSSLDGNSTELFMNTIKTIMSHSNIFIISHKEQMVEKFEHVIRFKKVQNFSRIS